jgi:hypothetical protein
MYDTLSGGFMVRMNIVMPDELAFHLKKVPNKSLFIRHALQEKIERERTKFLRATLAKEYAEAAKEDMLIDKDWGVSLNEGLAK